MQQDLTTANIDTQLLGKQKVMGILPGYVTEMSAFVINTRNVYLYISFVVPLSASILIAWLERIPDRY